MKIYQVGGSVRDSILENPVSDKDYLVVDGSEEKMIELGYTRVGLDFPVFLHPETKDEYALARVERSTGNGHQDFEIKTEGVTLEDDLARRDLTINAMAICPTTGDLIDLYGGNQDIEDKTLRHVSDAFSEDPIRVLRLARFAATLRGPRTRDRWKIAHETKVMCHSMRDQLGNMTPERVWKEVQKVLNNSTLLYSPLATFMETLYELRVLDVVFPEIYEMVHCREGSKHHREANVFVHTMMMLRVKASEPILDLAVLYHDVAKPYCYKTYGSSRGHHEQELVDTLLPNWLPVSIRKTLLFLIDNHTRIYKTSEMSHNTIASFLAKYKDSETLGLQLSLAHKDDQGRERDPGVSKGIQATKIIGAWKKINNYSPEKWISEQDNRPSGDAIKQHIHRQNINIVKEYFT